MVEGTVNFRRCGPRVGRGQVCSGNYVDRGLSSPSLIVCGEHIDVVRTGKVRRAKLYYLRALKGKAARLKERD